MTENTFHLTQEELRKPESRITKMKDLENPKSSNVSTLKSVIGRNTNKEKEIDEVKANLPLPEQPPTASDWNSEDARNVNVSSEGVEGSLAGETNSVMRDPGTAASSARIDGRELHMPTAPYNWQGEEDLEDLSREAGE